LYSDLDRFLRAVQAIAALYERGIIRILIQPSGRALFVQVELRTERPDYEEQIASVGLTPGEVEEVAPDIADVLGGILADYDADEFGQLRADRSSADEDPEVSAQKHRATEAAFDLEPLRARTRLKQASNLPITAGISWEIAVKHADDEGLLQAPDSQVPYAILKLTTDRVDQQGWPQLARASTVMLLDADDVAFLVDSLTRLRDALHDIEKGSTPS